MLVSKNLTGFGHRSNTKFYEVATFYCDATNSYVVVRRWGKISMRKGGGQVKVENFDSVPAAQFSANKLKKDLVARNYFEESTTFGLKSGTDHFEHDMLESVLRTHYTGHAQAVIQSLDLVYGEEYDTADGMCPPVVEEKPEPIRAGDWASW